MCKAQNIESVAAKWASPVVIEPRYNGSYPMCVDYRKFNAMTNLDTYPVPHMDKCTDSLEDTVIFRHLTSYGVIGKCPWDKKNKTKSFSPSMPEYVSSNE